MKLLLKIIKVFAIILIVVAAVGLLFFPRNIHVERAAVFEQSQSKVYNYVSDMENYNKWSPWYRKDTAAKYVFEGPRSGVGAKLSWESQVKDVGTGSMITTEAKPDSLIRQELTFMGSGGSKSFFRFTPEGNGTKVTWGFDMDAGMNPLMRIMGTMMDGMLGKEFESGLSNMKESLNSGGGEAAFSVEETYVESIPYLFVKDSAGMNEISSTLGKNYGMISAEIKKQKLDMSGAPFAIYYNDDPNSFVFDAAIPVNKDGKDGGSVKAGRIKSGSALVVHYFGAYEESEKAHAAIKSFAKTHNKNINGAPWEVYVTDPGMEKDTAKWQTDVYYPIQ